MYKLAKNQNETLMIVSGGHYNSFHIFLNVGSKGTRQLRERWQGYFDTNGFRVVRRKQNI